MGEDDPFENGKGGVGAWLAWALEHATPDLGVLSLSPTLWVEFTLKKKKISGECLMFGK